MIPMLQVSGATEYNRYPILFERAQIKMPNPSRIMSFGCSTGEEIICLRELYYPDAHIWGVDINKNTRVICNVNLASRDCMYCMPPEDIGDLKFDMIFALAVICRWPDTKELKNCSSIITFSEFEDCIYWLDDHLRDKGILCIANTNFNLDDSSLRFRYTPIKCEDFDERVNRFDRNCLLTSKKSGPIWRKEA